MKELFLWEVAAARPGPSCDGAGASPGPGEQSRGWGAPRVRSWGSRSERAVSGAGVPESAVPRCGERKELRTLQ